MDLWKMNPWQVFLAGGPIMWPILLSSIFAVGIIIDRFWYLHSIKIQGLVFNLNTKCINKCYFFNL